VFTEYESVTDGQMDRQTNGQTDKESSCRGIVRAVHTRRAIKSNQFEWKFQTK